MIYTQVIVVMILLITIGLNVVFIVETGRRLKYQQQQLDQQYPQFLPTSLSISGNVCLCRHIFDTEQFFMEFRHIID